MIPIKQTILHSENTVGNCFQACIASILELPLDEVPHFCASNNWPNNFYNWLDKRGLYWLETTFPHGLTGNQDYFGYHVIIGKSPRAIKNNAFGRHGVVGFNGKMIFDPHPSDDFLAGSPKSWEFGFIGKRL